MESMAATRRLLFVFSRGHHQSLCGFPSSFSSPNYPRALHSYTPFASGKSHLNASPLITPYKDEDGEEKKVKKNKAKKKKKKTNNDAAVAMKVDGEDYEKRRTRSSMDFDRDLYRQLTMDVGDDDPHGHIPVMLGEVVQAFRTCHLRSFVDCTLGSAGHSAAIIGGHPEMQVYVGLDVDPVAHTQARPRIEKAMLARNDNKLTAHTLLRNFKFIKSVLAEVDLSLSGGSGGGGVDGILMDLGMSSMQVNDAARGFSVLADGPLDMRMDPKAGLKAGDILNYWPDTELGHLLRDYGEESKWPFLQKKIVESRSKGGLHSTRELVDLIQRTSVGSRGRQGWIKTATRVFQALRIAVNDELQTLQDALYGCFDCLSSGGRLAVISFHSLEDRIVKKVFLDLIVGKEGDKSTGTQMNENNINEMWCKQRVQGERGVILTRRPLTPSYDEERLNRRSRSAKLRVVQKF